MNELDEVLNGDADAEWVDQTLREADPLSAARLGGMDLAAGFDDLLTRIWKVDEAGKSRWRRRRVVVTLAVTGSLLTAGELPLRWA